MNDIFMQNLTRPHLGGEDIFAGLAAFGLMFVVAIIWSMAWKGIALWHAARDGEKVWFVALLLVNTLGILEILYIFVFRKKSWSEITAKKEKASSGEASMREEESSLPTAESSPAE